jgi:hypothetical protein
VLPNRYSQTLIDNDFPGSPFTTLDAPFSTLFNPNTNNVDFFNSAWWGLRRNDGPLTDPLLIAHGHPSPLWQIPEALGVGQPDALISSSLPGLDLLAISSPAWEGNTCVPSPPWTNSTCFQRPDGLNDMPTWIPNIYKDPATGDLLGFFHIEDLRNDSCPAGSDPSSCYKTYPPKTRRPT